MTTIDVGDHKVGPGHPCFVIAEAGVNHNGRVELALQLVDAAAQAGADAVKFQTFDAERLVTAAAPKADYQARAAGDHESQQEMLRRLQLSPEAHAALLQRCRDKNISFLSAPFDETSADFLETCSVAAYKIPSGEITNLPFLAHVARKGRPLIVSTGMSYLGEVEQAVQTIRAAGSATYALLHCVSNYPASPAEVNLRAMATLAAAFGVPVGYSDHTLGLEIPLAAVALGACIIEKHFTLDRTLPGPDHQASLEPDDLAGLVRGIRAVEVALGHGRKEPAPGEVDTARVARKSLVARCDIAAGTCLTEAHVAVMRPGTGLAPAMLPHVLGRTARVTIVQGTLLSLEMLA